jgi:hypothetical protein
MPGTKSGDSHPKEKLSDGGIRRKESVDFCPKDKLLDRGMRVRTNKGHAAEKLDNITQV